MFVPYGATFAMSYYGARYGFRENEYTRGRCHHDARRYFEELDSFRGQSRVWILLTHMLTVFQERENILRYLDEIGIQRDARIVPPHAPGYGSPAEAFLYDLSDTTRLVRAEASSFPILPPLTETGKLGCS